MTPLGKKANFKCPKNFQRFVKYWNETKGFKVQIRYEVSLTGEYWYPAQMYIYLSS